MQVPKVEAYLLAAFSFFKFNILSLGIDLGSFQHGSFQHARWLSLSVGFPAQKDWQPQSQAERKEDNYIAVPAFEGSLVWLKRTVIPKTTVWLMKSIQGVALF